MGGMASHQAARYLFLCAGTAAGSCLEVVISRVVGSACGPSPGAEKQLSCPFSPDYRAICNRESFPGVGAKIVGNHEMARMSDTNQRPGVSGQIRAPHQSRVGTFPMGGRLRAVIGAGCSFGA